MLKHFESIHFIGIGGIGMSALARILLARGIAVSGSDLKTHGLTSQLEALGAQIYSGHQGENIPAGVEYVVVSTAISEDNPEIKAARQRHIPVIHRADVLNYLLQTSRSISITGTHGKTTTSALMAMILENAQKDPTIIIGGEVPQLGTNAKAGKGEFTVAEVDESDQSLRRLGTEIMIITNLEVDHLDHYKNLDEIIEAVLEFISNQPEVGWIVANIDDPGIQNLLAVLPPERQRRVIGFGKSELADYRLEAATLYENHSEFSVSHQGQTWAAFELGIPGLHNIYNALGTLACAHTLGIELDSLQATLSAYQGVKRRFQLIGQWGDISVIDDYAHHPSEIKAVLQTAKLQKRPITAIFQPHRFSRTQALLHDFSQSFKDADRIIFMEIYAASEKPADFPIEIGDLVHLTQAENPGKTVVFMNDFAEIQAYLEAQAAANEMIMTIGAGNITDLAYYLVEAWPGKSLENSPNGIKDNKIVYARVSREHQDRKVV